MPSRRPSRRPTREESAEVDELVRKAAIATFIERGFDGTSMDAVARAAGVTRATLYARYGDKRALFTDVITRVLKERQPESAPATVEDGSLRGSLVAIGRAALARAVDAETVRLSVLLMTESSRFPDRVPKAHEFARYPHVQPVIDVLRRHQATGSVEVRDVELAAEQFLTMVASHPARLAAFGIRRSADEDERYLEHAVDLFIDGVRAR